MYSSISTALTFGRKVLVPGRPRESVWTLALADGVEIRYILVGRNSRVVIVDRQVRVEN